MPKTVENVEKLFVLLELYENIVQTVLNILL